MTSPVTSFSGLCHVPWTSRVLRNSRQRLEQSGARRIARGVQREREREEDEDVNGRDGCKYIV